LVNFGLQTPENEAS